MSGFHTYKQSDDEAVRYSNASNAAAAAVDVDIVSSTAGRSGTDGMAVTRGVDRFLIAVRLRLLHPADRPPDRPHGKMIDLAVVLAFFRSTRQSAEKN